MAYIKSDAKAFELLFRRHAPKLRNFLKVRLNKEDVEDSFQIIWLKLHKSRGSFDESRRFQPWLYKIAVNTLRDQWKLKKLHAEQLDEGMEASDEIGAEMNLILTQDIQRLKALMEPLPHLQKESLLLFELEELSIGEVSDILGISPAAVRQNLSRGRKKLREMWSEKP